MSVVENGREQLLSRAFVELADTLVADYDIIEVLDRLAGYSVELLAAEAVGIMLADSQRTLRVVACSQEDAEVMELLQLQADQGPCLECFRTGAPVSVSDLAEAAGRWPVFVAGVRGRCLTAQLQTALNSRVIIEQAKGVLAQRGDLSMDAAFDRLRRYARTQNARLSEVARQIVETDLVTEVLCVPAVGSRAADKR